MFKTDQHTTADGGSKLKIGQPGDKYEQEADRVADAVMRMPNTRPQMKPLEEEDEEQLHMQPELGSSLQMKPEPPKIQRICPRCKERARRGQPLDCPECEKKLQMKPALQKKSDGPSHASSQISNQLQTSKGQGTQLPTGVQQEMGHKMGADFSSVNIHTNSKSHQLNSQLGAKAFTYGSDIYFNKGAYNPGSNRGKHLLAHELTHVVQQRGSKLRRIQKSDFDVSGLPANTSSKPKRIFFEGGGTTIPPSEMGKIQTFASTGTNAKLRGMSSEEGSDAANQNVIRRRIKAVEDALNSEGYTGTITDKDVDLAAGEGQIEYRLMRSVEIIPAGASSSVPPTVAVVSCNDPHAGGGDYPAKYDNAHNEGERLITEGKNKLSGVRDAATDAALDRFFGSDSDAKANQVSGKLDDIKTQLNHYTNPGNHQCMNHCSSTTASNNRTGPGAMMTLCPQYFSDSLTERAGTLIHEAIHGTPSITGSDTAYSHHRLIEFLTPAQALQNPDSYRLFLLILDGQSPDVGPTHPDALHGMSGVEENKAQKAIAWLEMYLTQTYLQTENLYERVHNHRTAGRATWPAGFYKLMMAKAAPHFGLTAPPSIPSTEDEQVKLAAVFDRYRTMRNVFWGSIDVTKAASMDWSSGPGNNVEVHNAFFGLSPMEQVKTLLEQLIEETPDISSSLEAHYVIFLEEVRQLLGVPAPPP